MNHTKITLAAALVPLLFSTSELFGQANWIGLGTSGTPALWSVGSNWTGTVPTNSSTVSLVFNNSAANSFSTNDLNGLTVSSISVPAMFNAVNVKDNTITGNAITLGGNVTVDTGNWQNFGFGMSLAAARTFTINSGQLTLSGDLSGAGGITKAGGATLIISGSNSISNNTRLTINSGIVRLTSANALGAAASGTAGTISIAGGGTLEISSNSAINSYALGGGSTGTAGTVTLGRQSAGAGYIQIFNIADFGSRTMNFNTGANVNSGHMTANIGELRVTAGNNDRPMTLAGTAAISVGSASITLNGLTKRLGLDGTNQNNTIGLISNTNNGTSGAVLGLVKSNTSTWTLTAQNTYTGATRIEGGILRFGVNDALSANSAITLAGGTLDAGTFSDTTLGLLTLSANAAITLGGGSQLWFADSSAMTWGEFTLSIGGSFVNGSSIRFGTTAGGLTQAQLAKITVGGLGGYTLDSSGFLTAIPEPSSFAVLAGLGALGFVASRRRRR